MDQFSPDSPHVARSLSRTALQAGLVNHKVGHSFGQVHEAFAGPCFGPRLCIPSTKLLRPQSSAECARIAEFHWVKHLSMEVEALPRHFALPDLVLCF